MRRARAAGLAGRHQAQVREDLRGEAVGGADDDRGGRVLRAGSRAALHAREAQQERSGQREADGPPRTHAHLAPCPHPPMPTDTPGGVVRHGSADRDVDTVRE